MRRRVPYIETKTGSLDLGATTTVSWDFTPANTMIVSVDKAASGNGADIAIEDVRLDGTSVGTSFTSADWPELPVVWRVDVDVKNNSVTSAENYAIELKALRYI